MIDADDLGAFRRALRGVVGEEVERSARVLFHRPEIDGAPVELELDVAGRGVRLCIERNGEPIKGYVSCRTLRVTIEGEHEATGALMRDLLGFFEEERRMDCRAAEHFVGNPRDFTWHELRFPAMLLASMHELLEEELAGFRVVGVAKPRNATSIVKTRAIDARGREVEVYRSVRWFRRREDTWLVIDLGADGAQGATLSMAVSAGSPDLPTEVLTRIEKKLETGFGLVERVMSPSGEELKLDRRYAWDELYLEPATKSLLMEETLGFFASAPAYARMKVPHRRGLLLHGAPGTGKTLVGKILASTLDRCVFLWITAKDVSGAQSIAAIFELARRADRVVLFFEDLDLYASSRARYGGDTGALGELLVQLDGMRSNAGMLVVATTNDIQAIEPALKDRPSRFDRRVELKPVGQTVRVAHLARLLEGYGVRPDDLAPIAKRCEGFTGAQLQELAFRARMAAARAGRELVGPAELAAAFEDARTYRAPVAGFRSDDDVDGPMSFSGLRTGTP